MTMLAGHVLLVDDEPAFQRLGSAWLQNLGHQVSVAGDTDAALQKFSQGRPDVVLLDLAMPPSMDPDAGIAMIARFLPAPVIVITGHADRDLALRATSEGAWDFLAKPIDPDILSIVVGRAVQKAKLEQELVRYREDRADDDFGILGHSKPIRDLRDMIRRLAPTELSVVILGPTGTGKELVAKALHEAGDRRKGPFVAVHCGAVPAELLESELFGHLKGSFTGAHRDQKGLVEAAHQGTLFLDEIGEMPPPMQVKLLRFLQEGTFLPIGGRELRRSHVRVVAATHRDLEVMVGDGSFREDLFYRLKGMILRTPSLSDRRDDIPALATLFLKRALGRRKFRLSGDAINWLIDYNWPGNVRELQSLMMSAAALAGQDEGELVVGVDLFEFAQGSRRVAPFEKLNLNDEIAALERRMIMAALTESRNNRSEAARILGISRIGLLKKLDRLGLRDAVTD